MHAPNQDSWGIHGGSSPAAPESGAGWYPRPMPPMANPPPELLSPRRALIGARDPLGVRPLVLGRLLSK